jgi:ribosomal protein S18 acetylase RimI-like enzyme
VSGTVSGNDLPARGERPLDELDEAVSVRAAVRSDAEAIGAVQARAWRLAYADLLPLEVLAELTDRSLADPWRAAITDPPSPQHRVLVACAGRTVVGFVALADIELTALVVDPMHQRRGHGSRLLAAAVDTLRDNGLARVQIWVPAADGVLLAFLGSAGVIPDGARRTYEGGPTGTVTEVRAAATL